jgi:hypothetical protein
MDRTIGTMLVLIFVLLLISIGQSRTVVKLERELEMTNNMVKKMCTCRPLR